MCAKEELVSSVARSQLRSPPPEDAAGINSIVDHMNRRADPFWATFDNSPRYAPHSANVRRLPVMNIDRRVLRERERLAFQYSTGYSDHDVRLQALDRRTRICMIEMRHMDRRDSRALPPFAQMFAVE